MNISRVGLSKAAVGVLDNIDEYLDAMSVVGKRHMVVDIKITPKDFKTLYNSATKDIKEKPPSIKYNGLVVRAYSR